VNQEKLDRISLQRYQDRQDDYHGGWRSSMVCSTWADFVSLSVVGHEWVGSESFLYDKKVNIDLDAHDAARLVEQLQRWLEQRSGR
jgi:hypothetical protein